MEKLMTKSIYISNDKAAEIQALADIEGRKWSQMAVRLIYEALEARERSCVPAKEGE